MSTKYENYITGDDANYGFYATIGWAGQTFTPSIDHIISSIKVKLHRLTADAAPGTITATIRATSSGVPTGSALVSGTYANGNTITTTSPGEWIAITISGGYLLLAGRVYTITLKCQTDDPTKPIAWRRDSSGPSYTGGSGYNSPDEGSTWNILTGTDFMFEEWGDPQGSGAGGAIWPSNALNRTSGLRRTFWSGLGGQAGYNVELALGGMSITYVSPIGEREPASAVTPTKLPSGPGYTQADYQAWITSVGIATVINVFGHFPSYAEWLRKMAAGLLTK